jgi:hypothetical protein
LNNGEVLAVHARTLAPAELRRDDIFIRGPDYVERASLPAAFNFAFGLGSFKIKIKSSGQECPLHTKQMQHGSPLKQSLSWWRW